MKDLTIPIEHSPIKNIFKKIFFPFKWLLGKIAACFRYFFIDNYYKINLVVLPNTLFKIIGASIIIYGFKNIKEDTTHLTNYGFAILVGIASVCFSWVRGLDSTKEPLMIQRISTAGESSVHCAIIFLMASALKYATLHLDLLVPKTWKIPFGILDVILTITYCSCFTLGFYKLEKVICDINKILYERLHKGIRN